MARPRNMEDVSLTAKDILSEKDYDFKKAGIVSSLIDKKITVRYQKGGNFCFEGKGKDGKQFFVVKAQPKIVGISGQVAINHELAHLLFNSFDPRGLKTIKNWSHNISNEYNRNSEYKNSDILKDLLNISETIYLETMNVIEDQRIESLWGNIYLGNKKEFISTRKKLGKDLTYLDNPAAILLAERFFRPDLLKGKYKHIASKIHDVENKDVRATMILLKSIKKHVDKVIIEAFKALKERNEAKTICSQLKLEDISPASDRKCVRDTAYDNLQVAEKKLNEKVQKTTAKLKDPPRTFSDEEKKDIENAFAYDDVELDEIGMSEEAEKGQNKIESVKDKLSEAGSVKNNSRISYKPIARGDPEKFNINTKWVKEIRRLLRTFKEKQREEYSVDGYTLDVGEYINMKSQGYGECLVDDEKSNGLSIVVSVDGSGSMRGAKNSMVQKICGTVFKAVEGQSNIDLKVLTWTSDNQGNVNIKKYEKYDDLKQLMHQPLGYTPTHLGITHGSEELFRMNGRKKLLIVITDGMPMYYQDGKKIQMGVMVKQVVKAWKMALKRTPNMMMVGVGYGGILRYIFKNRFINCGTVDSVEKLMMKTVKREIVRAMR